ncbi:hypothetical protein [Mycobacterium montefiorense]|uniref:ESX-1 secretion system protein EccA1-like N-terminal domain-containing protein n=1 Tax=Mycobacterium montefiorense TaxID=154654 RepID=A0AA37PPE4_9MYCO|nr:hypothetical protein [Mycobacterium montefiorense]GBG40591.1 hypothetical protein MmonteBS_49630 [Mycobacterium montefiorense]GKU33428.1 hypothetical protein NJB14191_07750 [Mycobacterium montefiorense]GKU39239.1 hypothetical protein NJB14192_12340 [Mycobacterium montefiorense]GKU44772.1 hypothetical protein NJB14194_13980 [Mycobacterium montefiorense]GKU53308.1 hypothetical protein NJB14195_45490 [Mycobacterium montefiorense]
MDIANSVDALSVFVMGIRHLRNGESAQAREAFMRATLADPMMCDAWLGRLAAGEQSVEVAAGAHEARRNFGMATNRSGVSIDQLDPRVTLSVGALAVQVPIRSTAHLGVAYAAALAEATPPQLTLARLATNSMTRQQFSLLLSNA